MLKAYFDSDNQLSYAVSLIAVREPFHNMRLVSDNFCVIGDTSAVMAVIGLLENLNNHTLTKVCRVVEYQEHFY